MGVLALAGTTAAPLRLAILVRRLHCVHEALSLYVRLLPSMLCGNLPAPVCHKVLSTCLIAYDKRKPALLCLWLTILRTNVPAPALPGLQASTVVSSAGTIHSPALLLRSGISCGGAVGTNLRLHPCTCVVGVFPPGHRQQPQQQQAQGQAPQQPATGRSVGDLEDLAGAPGSRTGGQEAQPQQEQQQQEQRRLHMVPGQEGGSIRCWEGTLMSIFSNQVGDWEGSGYGSLLYTPAVRLPPCARLLCCTLLQYACPPASLAEGPACFGAWRRQHGCFLAAAVPLLSSFYLTHIVTPILLLQGFSHARPTFLTHSTWPAPFLTALQQALQEERKKCC